MTDFETKVTTSSATKALLFDKDGKPMYPCRCGETHTGDYAAYDYGHHNCFHSEPLTPIDAEDGYYMCIQCGEVFWLDHPAASCPECGGGWRKASNEKPVQTYECEKGHKWTGPNPPFPQAEDAAA